MRRMYADLPITWNGVGEVAVSAVDDPPGYSEGSPSGWFTLGTIGQVTPSRWKFLPPLNFNGTAGSLKRTPRCPVHVNA